MALDPTEDSRHFDREFRFAFADKLRGPEFASSSQQPPEPPHHRAPKVPDLRFEQSYLRGIRPYVEVQRVHPGGDSRKDEKGKAVAVREESPREVIQVQWGKVVWITTRDQVLSPMIQGLLWGVASHFLRPFLASFFQDVRTWWVKGGTYSSSSRNEGQGVGKLRYWLEGVTSGTVRHNVPK